MKVARLSLSNVRSFDTETVLELDAEMNVIVGPNGGGKSNVLDILTIILRRFFFHAYRTNEQSERDHIMVDLYRDGSFPHLPSVLGTFNGAAGSWIIELDVYATPSDLQCMTIIKENKTVLEESLALYRNKPLLNLDIVDGWNPSAFSPGALFRYTIQGDTCTPGNALADIFLQYLNYRELFQILATHVPELTLPTGYLYFSPYRGVTNQDIRANLSGERLNDQLLIYFSATSRSTTSLIKLASLFFAEKRRNLEGYARDHGYQDAWDADKDVQLVSKHMNKLGYDWDLVVVDRLRNIYEIILKKEGRSFAISQASSGEREILNFMLGMFAFNLQGGLVIIDEPEVHLHPKWQRALLDLLTDLGVLTDNQIILATHSPTFITPQNIVNVIRVSKGDSGATKVNRIPPADLDDRKALVHIVTSHNNEKMFFSDKVVLVEGIMDRLLFENLIRLYSGYLDRTEVTEVLEVHGKINFERYRGFLESMGVKTYVIADLDYVLNISKGTLKPMFVVDEAAVNRKAVEKKSKDRVALIEVLGPVVETGDPTKIDLSKVRSLFGHITSRHTRLRPELSSEEQRRLGALLEEQARQNTFILKIGEIEDYLPEGTRDLDGLIQLVRPDPLTEWLKHSAHDPRRIELDEIVLRILGSQDSRESVLRSLGVATLQGQDRS